eukprot:TRINITY_DN9624_c0_g1_i1.p1 TRINITY_DN9624_c0_g1~~TRINITY_DN9624_c0_g1_i1.p1  ORF type:complete len:161 (+),score=20.13 TRINITY_DN9624_c0_g1_i1:67-549(+)
MEWSMHAPTAECTDPPSCASSQSQHLFSVSLCCVSTFNKIYSASQKLSSSSPPRSVAPVAAIDAPSPSSNSSISCIMALSDVLRAPGRLSTGALAELRLDDGAVAAEVTVAAGVAAGCSLCAIARTRPATLRCALSTSTSSVALPSAAAAHSAAASASAA